MVFKSHLAVLVLLLCGLHLTGSADHTSAPLIHPTNRHNEAQLSLDKIPPESQPTIIIQQSSKDKDAATSATQLASTDKTAQSTVSKTTQLAEKDQSTSTRHAMPHTSDSQPTSVTQHTSTDKTDVVPHSQSNKTLPTGEPQATHKGGSSATIPSLFTIALLMCVFLL